MGKEYLSRDDVRLRLNKTICLLDKEPVYVVVADLENNLNTHKVTCYPLAQGFKGKSNTVDYRLDNFDYKYISLGYMQYKKKCYYLSRLPDRKNNQGVCYSVIYSEPNLGDYYGDSWFFSQDMVNCIKGTHKTISEACDMLRTEGYESVPVHRYFAVGKVDRHKVGLYYKTQLIGIKRPHSNKFDLIETRCSTYMQRMLEQLQC